MAKKKKKNIALLKDETPQKELVSNPKKMETFYVWDGDTLVINILGTPSAKKDQIGKVLGNQLKVSVKESPRNGRATDYMVRFLAVEFGVSTRAIEVVMGRFNINKQLRIANPQKLPAQIVPNTTFEKQAVISKKNKQRRINLP